MFRDLVNFRDIGGMPSRHGGTIRTGQVFRAGLFSFVGDEASDRLVHDLGVRSVIDLRMAHELDEHPSPPMYGRHAELTPIHIPFFLGSELAALSLPGGFEPEPWATRYVAYTDVAGRYAITKVAERIADTAGEPLVFHCWSGKDRTGMTAACLLDLLGADDAAIGADYEQSMHWWLDHLDRQELAEDEPRAGYNTVAAVIEHTLAGLRDRYGSIEEMLLASGMHPATPTRLRDVLIDSSG